jgi:hypothetical protein
MNPPERIEGFAPLEHDLHGQLAVQVASFRNDRIVHVSVR